MTLEMESLTTSIRKEIKNLLILFEYVLWLLLDPSKFTKIKKKEIKKVLIIHLGAIGEILTATPLLPALKKELNCEISFMVQESNKKVFKYNPYISKIIIPKKGFKENVEYLKKKNFDLAVVLFPASTKISLMCFFSKIKYKIGCYGAIRKGPILFFTKRVFPINRKHIVEFFLNIIKQIGINNRNPKIEFYISNKEKEDLKKVLAKLKIKHYMIVHPGFSSIMKHKYPSRLWPLERYVEVIDYLIEKYKVNIFLTGSKEEKIISDKIKEKVKNKKKVIIANELFDIRGLAALISKSKFLFSSGTGIVYIATALNIPGITLGGKGNLTEWSSWTTKNNYRLLFHPEVCTGCEKEYCRKKNQECLKAITVKEVKNNIDELIKENYKGGL